MASRIEKHILAVVCSATVVVACGDDGIAPTQVTPEFRSMSVQDRWALHEELHTRSALGAGGEHRPPLSKGITLVGFLDFDLGSDEFVSDVWALGDAAYVGGIRQGFFAPQTPAKVVDISDPADPRVITELEPMGRFASPQDVKATRINTRYFSGDMLVVGHDGPQGGIQLWDVTSPWTPALLGALNAPGEGLWFTHNAFVYQRGNRAYVATVTPFEEQFRFSGRGDVILVEITDPAHPEVVGDWGAGKDGGFPFGFRCDPSVCRGAAPFAVAHDVWVNEQGTIAYVSFWDLGLILLDISDPANPTLLGRGVAPPTFGNDDGDLHVAVPAQGGNLVVTGDEDASPAFGGSLPWGFMRVFNARDVMNPVQVGAFATEGALNDPTFDDPFERTMHNVVVRGQRTYVSWYGEGIRVVDISQPSAPREVAAYVPSAGLTPGLFWGIYAHRDLVFGSDMLGGLYILELGS